MPATTAQPNTQTQETQSPLYSEPLGTFHHLPITNSLLASWVTVIILSATFIIIGKKAKKIPGKLQSIFEILLEGALNLSDSVTGDRKKTEKFLPVALTLFLFILVNNWLGLVPGFGTIGFIQREGGQSSFVPFLRGGAADLNFTLALALFSVILANVMGMLMVGTWEHFNRFVNMKALTSIPKKIKKDVTVILVNPIMIFVGFLEIISEIAKVASLSFRLFGNIFAGEVLLASMTAIFAYILPIPFMFLEILVGFIQALIFAALVLVYMTIATQKGGH